MPNTFADTNRNFQLDAGEKSQVFELAATAQKMLEPGKDGKTKRELRLTLTDPTTNASQVSVTPRNWHETITVRVGLESDLSQFAPRRFVPKVRLGFAFDQSPVPAETLDPSLPDGNRYLVSGGLSLGLRHVGAIELAYMAVFPESRTAANPDLPLKYSTSAHVLSAGLVIQLDNLLGKRSAPYARGLLSQDL